MGSTQRQTWWIAKRAALAASLAIAEETYNGLLAKSLKSYNFSGGEGSQAAVRRDLSELKEQIDKLSAEIQQIDSRLNGCGIVGIQVTRWRS